MANSKYFQKQSTSRKPRSRSQRHCSSTGAENVGGAVGAFEEVAVNLLARIRLAFLAASLIEMIGHGVVEHLLDAR